MLFVGSLSPPRSDDGATMSESNDVSDNSLKTRAAIVVISCVAVALGAGYGAHLHAHATSSPAPVKTVAKSIKLADGFIKGAKVIHKIHSPTPTNLIFLSLAAFKAITKTASKGLIIKNHSHKFTKISKGLKASEGALNLVRYSSVLKNYGTGDPFEFVIKGYKLFKGALNVVDGFNARGYGAVKGAVEGVSMVVKAAVLSKQMYGILIQSLGISHGAFRVLVDEMNRKKKMEENEKDKGESWRPRWDSGQRFGIRVSCLQKQNGVYGIECEKNVFLKCLLAAELGAHQSQGFDLDCIFSLSVPCPGDNNERMFRSAK